MINKIVVFAAGRGTRMRNLASDKPKHLILVNGKPFLYYLLQNIKQAGYEEIIVITGHLSEKFKDFKKEYVHEFPDLDFIDQFKILGKEKYGSLMPLLAAKDKVIDDQFVALNGDNLFSVKDLASFRDLDDEYNYIGGLLSLDPTLYGTLVQDKNDFLIRIDEKNPKPESNIINAGLYKFNPEVYDIADRVELSPRGEYEITDAVTKLAGQKKVKVLILQDYWIDFGKPEDISELENFLNKLISNSSNSAGRRMGE